MPGLGNVDVDASSERAHDVEVVLAARPKDLPPDPQQQLESRI